MYAKTIFTIFAFEVAGPNVSTGAIYTSLTMPLDPFGFRILLNKKVIKPAAISREGKSTNWSSYPLLSCWNVLLLSKSD